jgi:hypothetical protein
MSLRKPLKREILLQLQLQLQLQPAVALLNNIVEVGKNLLTQWLDYN